MRPTAMWCGLAALLSLALPQHARNAPKSQVTEQNLRHLLTTHEWRDLFGPDEQLFRNDEAEFVRRVSVVWPRESRRRRRRRSKSVPAKSVRLIFANNTVQPLTLHLDHLPPSSSVADEGLLVLSRFANSTAQLPDWTVRREEQCLMRGAATQPPAGAGQAAVSLCGAVIRGLVAREHEFLVISPLPSRLRRRASARGALRDTPHVLVRGHAPPASLHDFECAAERALDRRKRNLNQFFRPRTGTRVGGSRGWWRPSAAAAASGRRRSGRGVLHQGPLFVELAVFVDRDLFRHMAVNFPRDTEREVTRVVLAMVNAVQLLYQDASLGRAVTFVLKRLEVLHAEPAGLTRSHDIDRFLSSFCKWQRLENPPLDADPLHWDHAVLLTGLDLYVQLGAPANSKTPAKLSSQVVGLAPVGGMCSRASSCTVNEGRHFESVYVVAHEIGHNLGMRHDGPMSDNECDPGSFIMSPTLGSGKITWSQCSRRYLDAFLETEQASCLWDRSVPEPALDHAAGGLLPGERFSADHQCMLKYGSGSVHARTQPLDDVCRDLHCQRDRYTWTSHPALEGTTCGLHMWCRSGRCVARGAAWAAAGERGAVAGGWGEWTPFSECASSCLHGSGGLDAGSSGVEVSVRRCDKPRPENGGKQCVGSDRRYRACEAAQICSNVPRTTLRDFADEVCGRAKEVDADLLGTGTQRESSDAVEACAVWCYKKRGGAKNRGWTFPDGTACKGLSASNRRVSRRSGVLPGVGRGLCVSGRCESFSCALDAPFKEDHEICTLHNHRARIASNSILATNESSQAMWSAWRAVGGGGGRCKSNCIAPGRGLRLVTRDCHGAACSSNLDARSIQLCEPEDSKSCVRLKTPFEHASAVCSRYKERVRRLSGIGMQISPSVEDPDRPCRVACQDEAVPHRFYLVNGEEGWFPFGTDCGRGSRQAYCVSGKCLEFGADLTPRLLHRLFPAAAVHHLLRPAAPERRRRSVLPPANHSVTATLDSDTLTDLIHAIEGKTEEGNMVLPVEPSLDLHNPIHVNNPPLLTDKAAAGFAASERSTASMVSGSVATLLLATSTLRRGA
ncbi:A disintegrin and metalloproteinase with thrombospondin motifs adt-1-like [Neocloeon triangulifer]|uniref:A disintegrin and metalloproteinase with thrombospondin motifs adt-1-like n=1 Tax=Neocloeon triangulifer TaxID=2078957 RepID=UPI00286F4908|nr:A disintegrin and metalloproteinase with thrombospondin motifs adt-1-like [Neocloeon triangulifer]